MSMMSEFLVLGALGSVVLGPKKMAKLAADISRIMAKLKAAKEEFAAELQNELSLETPTPHEQQSVSLVAPAAIAGEKQLTASQASTALLPS